MKSNHQWRNLRRRSEMQKKIDELEGKGFTLEWITPYQCRVNHVLDLYPTNRKFHNLMTGERGMFADAYDCMVAQIQKAAV